MATMRQLANQAAKTALAIAKNERFTRQQEGEAISTLTRWASKMGVYALLTASFGLSVTNPATAQTVTRDASGNYREVAAKKAEPLRTSNTLTTKSGEVLIVWTGEKGGKFVVRTSKKTGKTYRQYLKG